MYLSLQQLIVWSIIIVCMRADLSLFSKEELIEQSSNIDESLNRLYLFSNTKDCSERLTESEKKQICEDYCSIEGTKQSNKNELISSLPKVLENELPQTNLNLNLTGALAYYKSFVHSFLNFIQHQDHVEDVYEYKIGVELNKFQIMKLKKFSQSVNETDTSNTILDITDILKEMFVHIEMNKKPSRVEKITMFIKNEIIDSNILFFFLATSAAILTSIILYFYFKRYQVNITLRKVLALFLFALFILSVINNHKYLSQKKHILNQQKLKVKIPEECLISDQDVPKEKSVYSNLVSFIRSQVGYTATSRQCLEYHEALFIASGHNNYVETVVYTISEGIRPISTFFGKSINEFYSALTQDLAFYQYIPLITMVSILFLPIGIILICFICLVLFGYEFNFFHLFSFKKSQNLAQSNAINNENLLPLLNMIKNKTNRLQINTLSANEFLPSIDNGNLSESLTGSLEIIFERISDKQLALENEIKNLKNEKKKMCIKDCPNEMEKSEIEEAGCLSIEYENSEIMHTEQKEDIACKQVSIGISKSATDQFKNNKKPNALTNSKKSSQESISSQSNNEESEDEDIFVILDEN